MFAVIWTLRAVPWTNILLKTESTIHDPRFNESYFESDWSGDMTSIFSTKIENLLRNTALSKNQILFHKFFPDSQTFLLTRLNRFLQNFSQISGHVDLQKVISSSPFFNSDSFLWLEGHSYPQTTLEDRLSSKLHDFSNWISPTPSEIHLRLLTVTRFSNFIESEYPDTIAIPQSSTSTSTSTFPSKSVISISLFCHFPQMKTQFKS
jgi:hypothetical protein